MLYGCYIIPADDDFPLVCQSVCVIYLLYYCILLYLAHLLVVSWWVRPARTNRKNCARSQWQVLEQLIIHYCCCCVRYEAGTPPPPQRKTGNKKIMCTYTRMSSFFFLLLLLYVQLYKVCTTCKVVLVSGRLYIIYTWYSYLTLLFFFLFSIYSEIAY